MAEREGMDHAVQNEIAYIAAANPWELRLIESVNAGVRDELLR
jgi:hypothetical protein